MEDHTSNNKKRVRDNSDDSAEVKRLREDLLGFLDDSDADPTTQDLDSVMKSFEEEIAAATNSCQSSPRPASDTEQASETDPASVPVVDLTSESGESNPDLGYLLEASDDELGLPPSENFSDEAAKGGENELVRVSSDLSGADDLWRFDDPVPSYDSLFLESQDKIHFQDSGSEYDAFGGLFGNNGVYFDAADYGEFSWRFETLPAQ